MTTSNSPGRKTLRAFAVAALSLVVVIQAVPELRRIWLPLGAFGYGTNFDGVVTGVDADSPAGRAGIRVGDRVDISRTPPEDAWFVVQQSGASKPGDVATFDLIHGGRHRTVSLVASAERTSPIFDVILALTVLLALAIVAIAGALVLLRPSPVTWGFFLYCVAAPPVNQNVISMSLPYIWNDILEVTLYILRAAGSAGLLVFALRFLNDPGEPWRRSVLRVVPLVFVGLAALQVWTFAQAYMIGGPPGELLARLRVATEWLIPLFALYAFIDTYARTDGADRQRIQWVVLGFAASLLANAVGSFLNNEVTNLPAEAYSAVAALNAIAPLTFAYAIFRYRVIDVSFVVSRALVYAVLTTILVGVFSVIDWFFSDYLRVARLGALAEMGAVVAFGLWFNGLHRRVDAFVDATFFRQRHAAERRLAKNAVALPLSPTTSTIAHFLVAEPADAIGLASSALFVRNREKVFVREASSGWAPSDVIALDESDTPLQALALAESAPLSLYDHPWRTVDVPSGPARPVLALPIVVRGELAALAFYGSHLHGEPLDPDEINAIGGLSIGAAAAYDHLEAEALKRENDALRKEIAEVNARANRGTTQTA